MAGRYVQGISKLYVSYMLGICYVYVGYMLGICLIYSVKPTFTSKVRPRYVQEGVSK